MQPRDAPGTDEYAFEHVWVETSWELRAHISYADDLLRFVPLHPAALAFVSNGIVLVRVRVRTAVYKEKCVW